MAAVPLRVAGGITSAVLSALAYAHIAKDASGRPLAIVHRDITPSNILLSLRGEVKLVDFGIARSASRLSVTRTGLVRGTVAYMSPEQARGSDVDARADLFMVASVLYEMITLERAFPDGPLSGWPHPPSRINPALPAALDAVVMKALATDARDRYASAEEFRSALGDALAGPGLAGEGEIADWLAGLQNEGAGHDGGMHTATIDRVSS
jgi:serine/threonine-protein kinase